MVTLADGRLGVLREELWSRLWESGFRDKLRRVIDGLKSPPGSGKRKYAVLQLKRLWAAFAGFLVPALVFLLLVLAVRPSILPVTRPPIDILDGSDDKQPELDPVHRVRPDTDLPRPIPDNVIFALPSDVDVPAPTTPSPARPIAGISMAFLGDVSPIRSPITMRGIYSQRMGAAGRAAAIQGRGGPPAAEGAVIRALRWLKKHQESDGSWNLGSGGGPGRGAAPAMTGLSLLAFLAHGETPGDRCPEFGGTVRVGLEWVMAAQLETGRFRGQDSHEYGHPIATYALCEGYGLIRNPRLQDAASRAVSVIVRGQNADGGWNYNCRPSQRNDTSYTGWCVQALKAAQIAGVPCPGLESCLRKSADGVRRNASLTHDGFGYTSPGRHRLTCVGVLAMQLLGSPKSPEVRGGLEMLKAATCDWAAPWGRSPIYYWYYITQAKFYADDETWREWNGQFAPEFIRNQVVQQGAGPNGKDIGYWNPVTPGEHSQSLIYSTTLCTLSLEVYYRILGALDKDKVTQHRLPDIDEDDDVKIQVVSKEDTFPSSRRAF